MSVRKWGTQSDRLSCWQRRTQDARMHGELHAIAWRAAAKRCLHKLTFSGRAPVPCLLSLMLVVEQHGARAVLPAKLLEDEEEPSRPGQITGRAS